MSYKLELEIDALPRRINQGLGDSWKSRYGESRKWLRIIRLSMIATKQQHPGEPLRRARLKLTRMSSVEPDFDGLVQSFKTVIDALVNLGVLSNDKMSVIGQPEYKWKKVAPRKGGIKIEVIND